MRPRTMGELLAKRSGNRTAAAPAQDPRVTHPWWMDPVGLRRKCAPGSRAATGRIPERVPPDP
jgi:hypothetical protein